MVTFSPDGRRLAATGNLVQSLMLYDVGSRQRVLTLSTPDARIAFPRFSPDGNVIGVMSRLDGNLYLWRAPSLAEIEADEAVERAVRAQNRPTTGGEEQGAF